ncbi:MAG: TonB-dependent receptor [Bryobacteraceae bacterium]|nr:TonB-dependent receptor [Bryobacteraceae bacterium]
MKLAIVGLFCTGTLSAQISSGTLQGEVKDSAQGLMDGAQVTARSREMGFTRSAFTGSAGVYRMENLAPGTYAVTASRPGFETARAAEVLVEVNGRTRLDFELSPGDARVTVEVTAITSALQTDESSSGYLMGEAALLSLPLVGRNIVSLVTVGPGAIPRQLGGFTHDTINDVQGNRGTVALNNPIHGGRSTMNAYLMDGVSNTDRNVYAIAVIPPIESVQEFRVQSSLGQAEFANAGGGVVDVVTRAGSADTHGSLYEYLRNEAADARGFFDDPRLPSPVFRQNQFGGTLGGRLPVPATFFFGAYDGVRARSAASTLHLFPGAALRSGDFEGRNALFDPLGGNGGRRVPLAGNQIPTSRIDAAARRYIEGYLPLPNRPEGTTNYLDATPNEQENDSGTIRIDHQLKDRSSLFGRYAINGERGRLAGAFPERPSLERLRAQQAVLGYTRAGRNWVNDARVSFTRLRVFNTPESAFQTDVMAELGIGGFGSDPFYYGLPHFLVTNFETVLDATTLPQVQRDNLWEFSDSYSRVDGRHQWKVGVQWIYFQLNYLQSRFPRGLYQFTGTFTSDSSRPGETGDPFADFLLGFPQSTRRSTGDATAHMRQETFAAFVQDDWRINSRLTLNLGLRYEYFDPYSEKRGRFLNLDYSTLPGPPRLVREARAVEPDRNNLAPRVGLVWRVQDMFGRDTRAVFRAGYGVYYAPEIAAETYDLVRNALQNEQNETTGLVPLLTIEQGFPRNGKLGLPSYFGMDRGARTPYMQQWSAGVQRELGGRAVLDISYLGTKGTKLGRFRRFNTPLHVETGENLDPRPGELQSLRTFPELGPLFQRQHISSSSYHALQVRAEKRFSRGFSFLFGYVWSKSIDDSDAVTVGLFDSVGAQDERNLRLERGLSLFNSGRRLSGGFTWDLPKPNWMGVLLRGWQTSGIVTLQDGTPLNPVYFAADYANSGTPNRPNVVPGQKAMLPSAARSAERYFNTDAYSTPAPYTFGNAGRNTLPGPGNAVVDVALQRRFQLDARWSLAFRAEAFNALNHPNIGIPIPFADFGPFFGRIASSGKPRRFQFAARLDF